MSTCFNYAAFTGRVVYVGITTSNLPDTLPANANSNLITAQLVNSPTNTSVSLNLSAYNSNQWIAYVNYSSPTVPLTLVLSWSNSYSSSFTAAELSYSSVKTMVPNDVTAYNIAITPTNSISSQADILQDSQNSI